MSRPDVASYVQDFFQRLLFGADDVSAAALSADLAPDAQIMINGAVLHLELFVGASVAPFRAAYTGSVSELQDLNVLSNDEGRAGLVAQHSVLEVVLRADGSKGVQKATTLVSVGEKEDGEGRWITGIWQVMGPA